MSAISMFVQGTGLESFEGQTVAPDVVVVDVDDAELVAANKEVLLSDTAIINQQQRVAQLAELRTYGESIRPAITDAAVAELRSRVITTLGVDRADVIVGSVESYTDNLSETLLNAGLESISGLLRAALEALIKLIRNGARMMMNFFASAKVVLGSQLRAVNELAKAVDKQIEGWDEFMVNVNQNKATKATAYDDTPGYTSYFDQKIEPLKEPPKPTPTKPSVATVSSLDFEDLVVSSGGQLVVPSDLSGPLKITAGHIKNSCLSTVAAFNEQYAAMLSLFSEVDKAEEAVPLYSAIQQLTADKFLPLNRLTYQNKESDLREAVFSSGELLGGERFVITIPRAALYSDIATESGNRLKNIQGYKGMSIRLRAFDVSKFQYERQIRAMSRSAAQRSLTIMDDLLKAVIDSPLQAEANELSKTADKVANTAIARMNTEDWLMKNFQEDAIAIMSAMTVLTASGPRQLISYVNNLSTAVRKFVALSGNLN